MSNVERGFGSGRTDAQGFNGQAEIFRRAGRRGKVEHVIDRAGIVWMANITYLEGEIRFILQVIDVLKAARGEVVHTKNIVALPEQSICQMRAEETRCTGYEDSCHEFLLPRR